jgi:hypothetical protein
MINTCDAADLQATVNFATQYCIQLGIAIPQLVCNSISSVAASMTSQSLLTEINTPSVAILTTSTSSTVSAKYDNSALSGSAKAGIGIGVAAAIIIVAGLLLLFFRWRRRTIGKLLNKEMNSPKSMDHEPKLETNADVQEIFGMPTSNPVVHVLPNELANELPLRNNNAAEANSHPIGYLPQDTNSVQHLAEADGSAARRVSIPQERELDSPTSFSHNISVATAYRVSKVILEEGDSSAEEIQAASSMTKDLCHLTPSQAQISKTDPQAVPTRGYSSRGPQMHDAVLSVTPKAIKREILPLCISESTQSSDSVKSGRMFSRLDVLRTQIDKVREEKERLVRLQELDFLEAELQQEIMDEQRKESRVG